MAQRRTITRSEEAVDMPWLLPGVLAGAYVLTRLPFAMLTGLALGFAAGWSLRGEQERGGSRPRGREWVAEHEADASGTLPQEEKLDEMAEDSFPASDPPSYTATRAGKPRKR